MYLLVFAGIDPEHVLNQQSVSFLPGERPYKCHLPDCGRAFIQLSNLQQHLRNHDAQVERAKNRPFHCNICGKGFATESSLRTHTSKVSHVCRHRLYLFLFLEHFGLVIFYCVDGVHVLLVLNTFVGYTKTGTTPRVTLSFRRHELVFLIPTLTCWD